MASHQDNALLPAATLNVLSSPHTQSIHAVPKVSPNTTSTAVQESVALNGGGAHLIRNESLSILPTDQTPFNSFTFCDSMQNANLDKCAGDNESVSISKKIDTLRSAGISVTSDENIGYVL